LRDTALKEVHFERETAPALGADAFNGCTALIKIYIPDCDCYDDYAAQSQFSEKTDLIYGEDGTKCKPEIYDFKLYRKLKNEVTNTTACNSTSALTVGDVRSNYDMSVLSSSTSGLSEVIVGDCISGVSTNAFYGMTQLTSITFSDNVTTIAASDCVISTSSSANRLHDIVLGKKLKTIGKYAFYNIGYAYATNRPQFKIPKSVTSIGEKAFLQSKINKITFENGGRCDIGYCSFSGCASYSTFSIDTDSIRKIESYAFAGFTGLTSVRLTNLSGFTSSNATGHQFANCQQLKSITIIANGNTKINW
jgi:DNA mismatch repair ATPase MutS